MKNFNLNLLRPLCSRSLLITACLSLMSILSVGQVYTTNLTGPAEAPPNNSPATGKAKVTIAGTTMRVEANFSGLLGTTTASHIHAATATPGVGLAGVATSTPSFPGFPLGVNSGTMDRTYDMTLASSYNPAYINLNGGTVATAFAALKAALNAGRSYFNVHSSSFPGGEIRGFLTLCPSINVSIPDAAALPQGVLLNTVYPAYAPAASLTLTTNVSGGTGPYTYNWSNGSTASNITVSPTVSTQYSVIVQDQNSCPGTAQKLVNIVDVSGGKKGDKIVVCHKDKNSLTIGSSGVAAHLAHGDMLGSCADDAPNVTNREIINETLVNRLVVQVLSNPSLNHFDLKISGRPSNDVQLRVYDLMGRAIESKISLNSNQTLRIGASYKPGIYLVEIQQGEEKQMLKLVKGN